jgi:hypothetical protein
MFSKLWQRFRPRPACNPPPEGIEALSPAAALRRCMTFAYRACPPPEGGQRATQLRLFANGLACVTAGANDRSWPNAIGYTRVPPHGSEATVCVLGLREQSLAQALAGTDPDLPRLLERLASVAEREPVPIIRAEHAIPFAWNCQVPLTVLARVAAASGEPTIRLAAQGGVLRFEGERACIAECAGVVPEAPGEPIEAHAVRVRRTDIAAYQAALESTGLARAQCMVHVGGRREALMLVCAPLGSSYPTFYSYLPAIESGKYLDRYFVHGTVHTRLGSEAPA